MPPTTFFDFTKVQKHALTRINYASSTLELRRNYAVTALNDPSWLHLMTGKDAESKNKQFYRRGSSRSSHPIVLFSAMQRKNNPDYGFP
jgi:hypothetical protein